LGFDQPSATFGQADIPLDGKFRHDRCGLIAIGLGMSQRQIVRIGEGIGWFFWVVTLGQKILVPAEKNDDTQQQTEQKWVAATQANNSILPG
jgi:hypothetical protein